MYTLWITVSCVHKKVIFSGPKTVDDFGEWLFSKLHKGVTVIAHNIKGYDGIFSLNHILTTDISSEIILNGSKIMTMTGNNELNIKVIDSFNHLPMSLSKLPGAFGLNELKKGYSPHLFKTLENQNYVGSIRM